jgi:hypothetical protein
MDGACSTYELGEKCVQNVGWRAWREETAREPSRRWEDNIKMDIKDVRLEDGLD